MKILPNSLKQSRAWENLIFTQNINPLLLCAHRRISHINKIILKFLNSIRIGLFESDFHTFNCD